MASDACYGEPRNETRPLALDDRSALAIVARSLPLAALIKERRK